MVTPIKSSNNVDNSLKHKPFDETAMKKLQNDIQPFLKDKNLTLLKALIQKNESYSLDEIDNLLFTNIKLFKPITHHRMREFVRRRLRIEKKQNEATVIYHSDDSNFVSPYSRDSFSSKSDMNMSPNALNVLKKEIANLWPYEVFQKELCQLLWGKGDLKIDSSNSMIALNLEDLKPSTVLALKELINDKSRQLQNAQSNDKWKIINDYFVDKPSINDQSICEIYKLIRKREQVVVDENGRFSLDLCSMKSETIAELAAFLRPDLGRKKKIVNGNGNGNSGFNEKSNIPNNQKSNQNFSHSVGSVISQNKNPPSTTMVSAVASVMEIPHQDVSSSSSNHHQQQPPQPQSHQTFDIEKLRYLSSKIKECTKNERISDIFRIISENESMDQNNGTLNVKKMKPVTLSKLFDFITANNI